MGLVTALLLFTTGLIHHFIGGAKIWRPVLKTWQTAKQSRLAKGTLGFIWYGVTLMFLAETCLAIYAHFTPELAKGIYLSLFVLNLGFALSASFYGKLVYQRILASPQWIFFYPISISAFLAFISI